MKLSILFAGLAYAQTTDLVSDTDVQSSATNVQSSATDVQSSATDVQSDDTDGQSDEAADNVCYSDGVEAPCQPPKSTRSGKGQIATGTDEERAERKYNDLNAMAVKLFAKNGFRGKAGFDERKYWAYGCHCYLLGDGDQHKGIGKPKDSLDNVCKVYENCNKCVREKHGEDCVGELRKYTWKWSSKLNTLESSNAPGSCTRELFECDKQLVQNTLAQKDVFNDQFHLFWSSQDGSEAFDNRDPDSCPSGGPSGNTPVKHMCCGGHTQPWYWIGVNKSKCCAATADALTGNVVSSSDTCEHGKFKL